MKISTTGIEYQAEHTAKELILQSRHVAADLNYVADRVQKWLEGRDLTRWPGVNSLGILQQRGSSIDVLAGRLCLLSELLEQGKKENTVDALRSRGEEEHGSR